MSKIVFEQLQLDELLLHGGAARVILCDNDFVIPLCRGVSYGAIGDVRATIGCSGAEAARLGIIFENFSPEFTAKKPPVYANVPHGIHPAVPVNAEPGVIPSSFSGSFATSFSGSFSASFSGSFHAMYEYEYESGSFAGSFAGSFSSSFRVGTSFVGSAAGIMRLRKNYVTKEIAVNGYGLNLI